MITKNNILSYMESNELSLDQKEALANKKEKVLINAIDNLSAAQIIYYLFKSNIPKSIKKLISDKVDQLGKKYEDEKFDKIKEVFKQTISPKTEYLYKNYYPKELKKIMVENIYSYNVLELIINKSIPLEIVKIIIDINLTDNDLIRLLKKNIDPKIVDYITKNGFKDHYEIYYAINDEGISQTIKDKIIDNRVNINNIFDLLSHKYLKPYIKQNILNRKKAVIEEFIESLNKKNVIDEINDYRIPEEIIKKIFLNKINVINSATKKMKIHDMYLLILLAKNKELIRTVLRNNPIKAKILPKIIMPNDILTILNNEHIPEEFKNILYEKRTNDIKKQINLLSYAKIKYEYLSKDSSLPKIIKEEILKQKGNIIEEEVKANDIDKLISDLLYGSNGIEMKKIIIQVGINKSNIFKVINGCYCNKDILNLIISQKSDIIQSYLNEININDLIILKNIEKPDIKDEIILKNYDLIYKRLKTIKKDKLFDYINYLDVSEYIKNIIIELNGIKKDDIENFKQLIMHNNSKKSVKYFEPIKEFIKINNINFKSFIQYGCGNDKYKDWLDNIVKIIKDKKINTFTKVSSYLLENYYEDNQEENDVQRINNFLQTLSNFNANPKLLTILSNKNKRLTEKEKENLNFIFNADIDEISSVTSFDEIDNFKEKLIKSYKRITNEEYITCYRLKEIYNNFIFCKSNIVIEDIGGTVTLKALKEQNKTSPAFCNLVDELINQFKTIEKVNDSNSLEGLKNGLNYLLDNKEKLNKIQNSFSNIEKKVRQLFELDAMINLTKLSSVNKNDILNEELSKRYGGQVFDISDKNYTLYGHVLSQYENIADFMKGKSNGDNNFISVSPISYLGQKYYYDKYSSIIAFDTLPKGNFICSSIDNMGSNQKINKNSSEVKEIARMQRGILETSVAGKSNSEVLLYREGLIPCGIILPDGKEPNEKEMEYHKKYNLPFIITQKKNTTIENPKKIFKQNDITINTKENKIVNTLENIKKFSKLEKRDNEYTGREIAIITDCHSMYEPTLAVLENIRRRDIEEIYSLGDNIGYGPNPAEIVDMLDEYKVKSVLGNSECYNILGTKPFSYLDKERIENQEWTKDKLGSSRIEKLKIYKPSLDITIGNKKLALCHFANDIRWDFSNNSTWKYQENFIPGESSKQFLYTNSIDSKNDLERYIKSNNGIKKQALLLAKNQPLFENKQITDYDAIIQGHVHFEMKDHLNNTEIYTLRALAMGNEDDKTDACYYILKEKKDGTFDIEKRLVDFNIRNLISNIKSSSIPHKQKVLSFFK